PPAQSAICRPPMGTALPHSGALAVRWPTARLGPAVSRYTQRPPEKANPCWLLRVENQGLAGWATPVTTITEPDGTGSRVSRPKSYCCGGTGGTSGNRFAHCTG